MDVGMMMLFASYGWENIRDDEVWEEELQLARLAVDSGFDVLWSAEHHFFDYSFCPDNLQLMTHLAGLYPLGIKLTHSGYGNRSFLYHRDIPSM
jgi:hypothetical protein